MKIIHVVPPVLLALSGFPLHVQAQVPPNPAVACVRKLLDQPEFRPIAAKVYLGSVKDQPFTMLTITEKASEADRPLLLAWINARQECFKEGIAWEQQVNAPPQIIAIAQSVESEFLAATADVYAGKISYGDYAKKRAEILSAAQEKVSAVVAQIRQHQAEAQQRQAEAEAQARAQYRARMFQYLLNRSQPQPYVPPPVQPYQYHPPTTTTCRDIGGTLQCTTW